jgi:hypothetical protein
MSDTEVATADATPTETAAAGLETLAADRDWQADFNGDNGRPAQIAAVKLKSDVTRSAYNPEPDTTPVLPDALSDALKDPNATEITKAAAEAMIPGTDASEYLFRWEGAANMDVEQLKDQTAVAAEACMAIGASPAYAAATIQYIDQQLARSDLVPCGDNPDSVVEVLNQRLGGNADPTIAAAKAVCAQMPERSREWLFSSMDQLDASGFAWMITRLASIHKVNEPKP